MMIRDCGIHEELMELASRTPTQASPMTAEQAEAAEGLSPSFNPSP